MGFFTILMIAVGLAMDAFAVSITVGLKSCDDRLKNAVKAGLWFGTFQAGMNVLGWLLSGSFHEYIESYGHWVSFVLLTLVGFNMIREAFSKEEKECEFNNIKKVFILSLATSIDSLAVGISFSSLDEPILIPALVIGLTSMIISAIGVIFGNIATKIKGLCGKADFVGGSILIIIGLKILLEHIL